jgi:hypothetical protein
MTHIGRPSTVENHSARARIDVALDSGETYESIRTWTGLSVSALSRYAISRKSDLAKLAEDEPSTTDVIVRAVQIADDARDLRRKSRTSTPVARARAIKVESEALGVLIRHLGIDDTAAERVFEETAELVASLVEHTKRDPEAMRGLLSTMAERPVLRELKTALRRQIGTTDHD